MTSPFLHFYLSKSQNRCKLVAKFTILLQENHENCQECYFIHLQASFQWHKLDECTCPMKNTGCRLLTYIQQVYRTATGLLAEYCTAAMPAGRIHQSFFYSAGFSVALNTLQVISGMGSYGSNDHQVHLTMLQSYTCIQGYTK